jgi:hypothetical protein
VREVACAQGEMKPDVARAPAAVLLRPTSTHHGHRSRVDSSNGATRHHRTFTVAAWRNPSSTPPRTPATPQPRNMPRRPDRRLIG